MEIKSVEIALAISMIYIIYLENIRIKNVAMKNKLIEILGLTKRKEILEKENAELKSSLKFFHQRRANELLQKQEKN